MLYNLDCLFAALADPTRRAILRRLVQNSAVVGEIAALFPTMSLAAVSKHLHVLQRAGLVAAQRRGQFYRFELRSDALRHTADWLALYKDSIAATRPIALLGLSANPPHAGHLAISSALLALGYAEVWWSIAPEQEFKPASTLAPYKHRLKLAALLIKGQPYIRLDTTEAEMAIQNEHNRTAEWLALMAAEHPNVEFTFAMGADSWAHPAKGFHTWGGFADTLKYAGLLVIPRPDQIGSPSTAPAAEALKEKYFAGSGPVPRGQWTIFKKPLATISSTDIRAQLNNGETPGGLTPAQLAYLHKHKLYS